eukprot:1148082-Pelagomonas_calceolata.AAC.6
MGRSAGRGKAVRGGENCQDENTTLMMGTRSSNISCKPYAMASSCGWKGRQERGGGSEERIAK